MEQEFVPYELAVKLKELGFNENCIMQWHYSNDLIFCVDNWGNPKYKTNLESKSDSLGDCISAPTFSQAFRWLLKEYNLYAIIIPTVTMHWTFKTMTVVEDIVEVPPYDHVDANDYGTREEAELACLVKLIEIVETRTK